VAILWNFGLSERWVFRRESGSLAFRLASYPALNNAAFASTGPLLMTLVAVAALPVLASNVVSHRRAARRSVAEPDQRVLVAARALLRVAAQAIREDLTGRSRPLP
jgi:putative flippase GtrA